MKRGNTIFKFVDRYAGIPLCAFFLLFKRSGALPAPEKNKIKKILIIKLSAMGDTILLFPAVRALKENFPEARISMIATSINFEAASNCPHLDEVILFDPQSIFKNPAGFVKFLKKLSDTHFDVTIDADQWMRISALLSFASSSKISIGFRTPKQFKHFLFTNVVQHAADRHESECFLDLVRTLGVKNCDPVPEFLICSEAKTYAESYLEKLGITKDDKFVILHADVPMHAEQRQWPLSSFLELAIRIIDEKNARVLFTGTESRERILKEISCLPKDKNELLKQKAYFVEKMSLQNIAGIIQKSLFVVCNNTGFMHLASAVKVPVIGLHGPTNSLKWGPCGPGSKSVKSNLSCSPCLYLGFEYKCRDNKCMRAIEVKSVLRMFDF
jgi:ADP-heptose:LPS heptosyltransferase